MSKKMSGIQDDALVTGGIILVGYSLIRNLLPNLMGNVSPEDKQTLDDQQSLDDTENIFSYNSVPYTDWITSTGVDLYPTFGVDSSQGLYLTAYRQFLNGDLPTSNPLYLIAQVYHELHAAVTGHFISGDQDAANAALDMITNKWQLGALAEMWSTEQGSSFGDAGNLFKTVRNGSWPMQYGLNAADFAAQVKRLNNLPN